MKLSQKLSQKWKYFVGSLFYLSYTPKAYLYSRKRDRLERQVNSPQPEDTFDNPGKLFKTEQTAKGTYFYFEQAELEVSFLAPDLVQVNWFPGIPPIPYAIAKQDWQEVETILEETAQGWTVSSKNLDEGTSPALKVTVKVDGSLTFYDATGQLLREELPPQKLGEGWTHQARLRSEEHIYGLGERAAPLNLRLAKDEEQNAKAFQMWNYDAAGMYGPGADPMYI
ncbi:MAG: DUF4968 domain-containing protein, partial [Microcoleus sp. SIO2G3]|nr:DUF4968 domain-containing protein [Microcoleus sp. SIO2G3]